MALLDAASLTDHIARAKENDLEAGLRSLQGARSRQIAFYRHAGNGLVKMLSTKNAGLALGSEYFARCVLAASLGRRQAMSAICGEAFGQPG